MRLTIGRLRTLIIEALRETNPQEFIDIDRGIIDVVAAFRRAGFDTTQSCQGGRCKADRTHAFYYPIVEFRLEGNKGLREVNRLWRWAVRIAREHGYRRVRLTSRRELDDPYDETGRFAIVEFPPAGEDVEVPGDFRGEDSRTGLNRCGSNILYDDIV